MRPPIALRFRPSLIIFVDETGQRICEQLQEIVRSAGLDRILYQSIALLQLTSSADHAVLVPLDERFVSNTMPTKEGTLEQLVEQTIKDVQSSRHILEIINAGYPVPNPRTQIYIVGDTSQARLTQIQQTVQRQLHKLDCHTLVSYVLHTDRMRQQTEPRNSQTFLPESEQNEAHLTHWSQHEMTNFCYLYEDMLTYPVPTFISEAESYYAASEALFVLIATGLTTEPFFEDVVKGTTMSAPYPNVGSLGTSLILFPETAVLDHCSTCLGVTMLDQWLKNLREIPIPASRNRETQARARSNVRAIEGWMKDKQERPLANGPKSRLDLTELRAPGLDILREDEPLSQVTTHSTEQAIIKQKIPYTEQPGLQRLLYEKTQTLFALFWTPRVNSDYKRQKRHFSTWTEFVSQQAELATKDYQRWDTVATQAWNAAKQRICTEIQSTIEQLCSIDETGLTLATIYVDELEDRLTQLQSNLSRWHIDHVRDYRESLHIFESLIDSPTERTTATEDLDSTNPPIDPISPQHSDQEESIVKRLEQHIHWKQSQIPFFSTQIFIAIPFIIVTIIALLSFSWFPHTAEVIAVVTAVVIAIVGIGHWSFHHTRVNDVKEAQEDLLTFYRRYYAYLCEQREDRLRMTLMDALHDKVHSIRVRLDNITGFLSEIQRQLEEQAEHIRHDLFHSPTGSRDIFVVNGEILQEGKKNTLDDVVEQVTKIRTIEPVETWHQIDQSLKKQFITSVTAQQGSFLEMSQDEVRQQIVAFTHSVIQPYFKGPFVDVNYAMDKPDVWREALERTKNLLYRAQAGIREPQFIFACGRELDLQKGLPYIPDNVYPVHISKSHPWILVAAFFQGGVPTILNTDTRFSYLSMPFAPNAPSTVAPGTIQSDVTSPGEHYRKAEEE